MNMVLIKHPPSGVRTTNIWRSNIDRPRILIDVSGSDPCGSGARSVRYVVLLPFLFVLLEAECRGIPLRDIFKGQGEWTAYKIRE